jgi:hypothetical protein
MAGALLDELVDALSSDDEAWSVTEVRLDDGAPDLEDSLHDAEDYLRRAVQMQTSSPILISDKDGVGTNPEDQLDYYRRLVQLQATSAELDSSSAGFAGGSIAAKGIQVPVCSEFATTGNCKAGVKCGFVHDGAFRRGGGDGRISLDPEDFFRRAVQMRSVQRKSSRAIPERFTAVNVSAEHWVPYLGGW